MTAADDGQERTAAAIIEGQRSGRTGADRVAGAAAGRIAQGELADGLRGIERDGEAGRGRGVEIRLAAGAAGNHAAGPVCRIIPTSADRGGPMRHVLQLPRQGVIPGAGEGVNARDLQGIFAGRQTAVENVLHVIDRRTAGRHQRSQREIAVGMVEVQIDRRQRRREGGRSGSQAGRIGHVALPGEQCGQIEGLAIGDLEIIGLGVPVGAVGIERIVTPAGRTHEAARTCGLRPGRQDLVGPIEVQLPRAILRIERLGGRLRPSGQRVLVGARHQDRLDDGRVVVGQGVGGRIAAGDLHEHGGGGADLRRSIACGTLRRHDVRLGTPGTIDAAADRDRTRAALSIADSHGDRIVGTGQQSGNRRPGPVVDGNHGHQIIIIDQVIKAAQRIVVVGVSIGANPTEIGDGRIGRIARRGQDWRGRTADAQDIGDPVVRLVDVDLGNPAGVARGSIKNAGDIGCVPAYHAAAGLVGNGHATKLALRGVGHIVIRA